MASEMQVDDEAERRGEKLFSAERLTFFSDAVVAIALTLLALELPVPEADRRYTNSGMLDFFDDNRGAYIAFLISFAVIGAQWFAHHRAFSGVVGLAGRLPRWNMLWLLTIVLTPFATKVLTGDGAFPVRFTLYASVQALSGVFFLLMSYTMDRHNLRSADIPRSTVVASNVRLIAMTTLFLISIPVSFVTGWAYVCWAAYPGVARIANALIARRRAAAAPDPDGASAG